MTRIENDCNGCTDIGLPCRNCGRDRTPHHYCDRCGDADNIQSSQKFILDALVNNGVLPDDNRKHVTQIYHRIHDSEENKVSVTIETE